jgi:putative heme-binding domain-containing protein
MVTIARAGAAVLVLTMTLAWSGLTFAAIGMETGREEGALGAGAQKLTREEIFEAQNKQEQAGSAEAGRPIFEKVCASCHRFGEAIGTDVGPDLTTITSRFKKRDVLEAILWPSKTISDQYKSEMFEMKDGSIVSGVIVRENAANVFVRTATAPEKPVPVPKAQIANRAESAVSLMPEGLLDGYSQTDIANLLAFVLAPPPSK